MRYDERQAYPFSAANAGLRPRRRLLSLGETTMMGTRPLPVAALALAFMFLGADLFLNRPAERISSSAGPMLITSDPAFPVHRWTLPGPGGDWGLVGFSQARYRARSTQVCFGSCSLSFGFSIYAVAGFGACALFAAVGFATAAFCRDS